MSLVGTRPILQDELRQYELHHSVWFFFDDRDIATAITARHIPIIRHLLQHSWWSAWRYVLLGNNKNQERSVKEKNFMVYWERLNGMFGYTWNQTL